MTSQSKPTEEIKHHEQSQQNKQTKGRLLPAYTPDVRITDGGLLKNKYYINL